MCVIAYKRKDVALPSDATIDDMWDTNSDGAGVMWRDTQTNKIKFVKGFMKKKQFKKWLKSNAKWLNEVECALHFRITTHGSTSPGNCHPFVCDNSVDPHTLQGEADFVLMHNGVLPLKPRSDDISDSAELALRIGSYTDPLIIMQDFGELCTGSRVILMSPSGTTFYGDKWKTPLKDGILYSNDHFVFGGNYKNGWYWWDDSVKSGGKKGAKSNRSVHFDYEMCDFCNEVGDPIAIEDVDPVHLNGDEYEIYCDLVETSGFNPDLIEGAMDECMSVSSYAAMIGEEVT